MEVLINELSLDGQFTMIPQFVESGLIPFVALLKELNTGKNVLLKKQDFWNSRITSTNNLCDVLSQKLDVTTRFKSILSNLIAEPFWESSQKHNHKDDYEHNQKKISGTSLAESCEREKIVISFRHTNFSVVKLNISKNKVPINLDNLFSKEHYIEIAYNKKEIDKCEYFEKKFALGLITLLENEYRFRKTNKPPQQGKPVYVENKTGHYWHWDNFHTQQEEDKHYEVYDSNEKHIGIACTKGNIDYSKKVNGRTL